MSFNADRLRVAVGCLVWWLSGQDNEGGPGGVSFKREELERDTTSPVAPHCLLAAIVDMPIHELALGPCRSFQCGCELIFVG